MKTLNRNGPIAVTRPNWSRPLGVEYSFKTSIFTSRAGIEQREAMRQTARLALKFTTALSRAGLTRLHADLVEGQHQPTLVRAEWRRVKLTADHTAGGTQVEVSAAPAWLVAGIDVILTTETHEDHFTVSSVSGTTVTLGSVTVRDYSAGAKLHPAYWTRASDKIDLRASTDMVWQGNIRFDVTPGAATEVYAKAGGYAFGCREVFLQKPNWRDQPRLTFTQERDVFDPGIGLIDVVAPHLGDHQTMRLGYTGLTAEDAEGLIEFFQRMKGRRGSFWMPTWQRDVQPSATPLAPTDQFQVDGQDFRDAYSGHPIFNTMIAFWEDGSFQINRLTGISGAADSTDSTVEFRNDWVNPINESTKIMWMPLWRFDSDTLDVRWLTDEVAEMQFVVKTTYATDAAEFDIFDCPITGAGFSPGMEPILWGALNVQIIPPYLRGDVVDLYELGISQEAIDAGEILVAAKWEGMAQTGAPLVDANALVHMGIKFHSTDPVDWYHPPVPGGAEFSATQTGALLASVGSLTVPTGARFVQFLAGRDDPLAAVFTKYDDETFWAVGRNETVGS